MTEIPKEFLVNKDTIKDDFPLLAEHLKSVKKKDKVVSVPVSSDFPPDGCGIVKEKDWSNLVKYKG